MENYIDQHNGYSKAVTRDFFKNVYSYMFAALAISGSIAYVAGNEAFFTEYFLTPTGISPLFYVVAFAPVGLGLLIQSAYRRLSLAVLMVLFIAYSALMGLSLSTIFLVYAMPSIVSTFFVTAGAFAGMAILGYTTKTDLTKFGSLLYMVFIGIFIAGIVNIFMKSDMMGFIIAVIGVFVFTGLTAYYMQTLKNVSQDDSLSELDRSKLSLIGGLQLYILFVNLFLSLLRILGNRD
ncbi:MAG: Bax inhibitor-1/YccA family protein [Crocinitomicaceae bacterium]|nr:Bax inhibitor-1/YccA family protein [Crocinitomicaceae bacterium]